MKSIFTILAVTGFTGLLGMGIIVPIIPVYMKQMHISGIWVGTIIAAYSVTRVIMAPFIGRLSDKKGRRGFYLFGLFLSVISYLGYIWAYEPWHLVLVRILHGGAGGMIFPIAMSYIGDFAPEGEEGSWMGYFTATVYIAFSLGPFLGGVLTETFDIATTFILVSFLGFAALLIAIFKLPESKAVKESAAEDVSIRVFLSNGMIQGLFCYRLTAEAGWGIFVGFLPIFADVTLGLSPLRSGLLITICVVLSSIMMVPYGKMADEWNRKAIIIISGLAIAVCLSAIPHMPSFVSLLVLTAITGIIGSAPYPASSAIAVEEGRQFGMGSVISVLTMANSIGLVVGPFLGGVIMDTTDVSTLYYAAGAIVCAGVFLFTVLGIFRRQQKPEAD